MKAALILALCAAVYAQPEAPRFEVASVKPTSPDRFNGPSGGKSGNGRLNMPNVILRRCMIGAFGVGPHQIIGGPDWLDSDRFDIEAKAENLTAGDSEIMVMLQTLLAERFKLAVHRETRNVPVLVLEVAKGGPKLAKAAEGESQTSSGRSRITARSTTMPAFAGLLARQLELPVVDRTGLTGIFNLKLEWTSESSKPAADDGPSIFTAIQEQLGLRLRSQKAPVEMLVVDHAEKPSEN